MKIQAAWRGYFTRKHFERNLLREVAADIIQFHWRARVTRLLLEQQRTLLRNTFNDIDISGDGNVDFEELLKIMGEDLMPEELQQLMTVVDVDNNGELDFEEFEHLIMSWQRSRDAGTDFQWHRGSKHNRAQDNTQLPTFEGTGSQALPPLPLPPLPPAPSLLESNNEPPSPATAPVSNFWSKHLAAWSLAATQVQAVWRGYFVRKRFVDDIAAKVIQYYWQRHRARVYRGRDCRTQLSGQHGAQLCREHRAALVLQSLCRSWLHHLASHRNAWDVYATLIQSHWRGVNTRRRVICAMRKEVEELAPVQSLVLGKTAMDAWSQMLAEDARMRAIEEQFEAQAVSLKFRLQQVRIHNCRTLFHMYIRC